MERLLADLVKVVRMPSEIYDDMLLDIEYAYWFSKLRSVRTKERKVRGCTFRPISPMSSQNHPLTPSTYNPMAHGFVDPLAQCTHVGAQARKKSGSLLKVATHLRATHFTGRATLLLLSKPYFTVSVSRLQMVFEVFAASTVNIVRCRSGGRAY